MASGVRGFPPTFPDDEPLPILRPLFSIVPYRSPNRRGYRSGGARRTFCRVRVVTCFFFCPFEKVCLRFEEAGISEPVPLDRLSVLLPIDRGNIKRRNTSNSTATSNRSYGRRRRPDSYGRNNACNELWVAKLKSDGICLRHAKEGYRKRADPRDAYLKISGRPKFLYAYQAYCSFW